MALICAVNEDLIADN